MCLFCFKIKVTISGAYKVLFSVLIHFSHMDLQVSPMDFELDSKRLSTIINLHVYILLILYSTNFITLLSKFIRRRTNEIVHVLARVIIYLSSIRLFIEIPKCIKHIITNKMVRVSFYIYKK